MEDILKWVSKNDGIIIGPHLIATTSILSLNLLEWIGEVKTFEE